MISFLLSIVALIAGYLIYSKIVENIFGVDKTRETPAYSMYDGIDYVPMGWGKIFLIQFLNIAGLGPIFGAVLGAVYGPFAFLWIVLGCIFGGAVHDYFSGMLSVRHKGISIPEIVGKYMGNGFKQFMRIFTLLLMILVGAVFIIGPAGILNDITKGHLGITFWVWLVFIYYILATLLPIDKIIGRIYPVFGFAMLFMAVGIGASIFINWHNIPEIIPENLHNMKFNAEKFPIFPMLFVTVACGAISGFHSTQSPLMARCIKNEKKGRQVFYGAMVAEGIVALIWAAAAMSFYPDGVTGLNSSLQANGNNAAIIVNEISNTTLGRIGAILALLGVVAAPITSGDTAFRSARLIVADFLNFKQVSIKNRLMVSVPLFVTGFLLTLVNFSIIWRYMAWSNQTLATIVLWAITVYLAREKKFYWITLIPAFFMTSVISTYILAAPEGFQITKEIAQPAGVIISFLSLLIFFILTKSKNK